MESPLYSVIFCLLCYFFCSGSFFACSCIYLYIYYYFCRTPCIHFSPQKACLQWSPSLPPSRLLVLPRSPKDVFADDGIQSWRLFFFWLLKILCYFLSASMVWVEKSAVIQVDVHGKERCLKSVLLGLGRRFGKSTCCENRGPCVRWAWPCLLVPQSGGQSDRAEASTGYLGVTVPAGPAEWWT